MKSVALRYAGGFLSILPLMQLHAPWWAYASVLIGGAMLMWSENIAAKQER